MMNFEEEKMKKITGLIIIAILVFTVFTWVSCSSAKKKIAQEPYSDEFYEKTRLIMSKSEIQLYKHLPDQAARDAFIEDFWEKRDPSPGTEENENKMEFERRLEYADRVFKERVGSGRGWDSDRGKVYLLLGPPDQRTTNQGNIVDRFGQLKRVLKETWIYDYYRLYLEFADADELGVYRLRNWSVELLNAIEQAKFNIYQKKEDTGQQWLKLKAAFKDNGLVIRVPARQVTFDEKDDAVIARFKITIYIYHDYRKVDEMEVSRDIRDTKEALLSREYIELTVPYHLSERGNYLFDVIVKDMISGSGSREIISHKF
jgi:GWxTD domain-containing protein